ncbi:phosphate acyltransferase PlsX [Candidatus Cyanaurora vandensis]|uniref:phosphate acyltransferase PlsX n=1 Tax=Candidatus Cyanaurora vandensis TaxID=2714958 RepID=UPI00257F812B|nr:phosphate acyltransferase PlsX [Candidatus Cyanaurora vandensis]
MRIAVDAMGGDFAPEEIIAGALLAQKQYGVELALIGRQETLEPLLKQYNAPVRGIELVDTDQVIGMDEEPVEAIRRKKRSSINLIMEHVKAGHAQAAVTAGNTGAAMAAAQLRLRTSPGIIRPAMGALLPTVVPRKPVLLLDAGANVDAKPKVLEQFALMGYLYSRHVLGVANPRVGLLNIGEEAGKGNPQAQETYQLLADSSIPFAGNCEGRDVLQGRFDVVVTDGFIGNILLKFAEGVGLVAMQILKEELLQGLSGSLGTFLLRDNLQKVRQRMDYAEYGGGLLLGVNGVCIITHGSSRAVGVANALRLAKEAVDNRVLDRIQEKLPPL